MDGPLAESSSLPPLLRHCPFDSSAQWKSGITANKTVSIFLWHVYARARITAKYMCEWKVPSYIKIEQNQLLFNDEWMAASKNLF